MITKQQKSQKLLDLYQAKKSAVESVASEAAEKFGLKFEHFDIDLYIEDTLEDGRIFKSLAFELYPKGLYSSVRATAYHYVTNGNNETSGLLSKLNFSYSTQSGRTDDGTLKLMISYIELVHAVATQLHEIAQFIDSHQALNKAVTDIFNEEVAESRRKFLAEQEVMNKKIAAMTTLLENVKPESPKEFRVDWSEGFFEVKTTAGSVAFSSYIRVLKIRAGIADVKFNKRGKETRSRINLTDLYDLLVKHNQITPVQL